MMAVGLTLIGVGVILLSTSFALSRSISLTTAGLGIVLGSSCFTATGFLAAKRFSEPGTLAEKDREYQFYPEDFD